MFRTVRNIAVWSMVFLGWVCLYAVVGTPSPADASTLGWTTVVTTIFQEIRNIGFVCFAGGLVVAGIELIFHRHLDRLGSVMASIGVGGGLIGAGSAAAVGILGGASGATLTAVAIHTVSVSEAMGDIAGVLLYASMLLGTLGAVYLEGMHHGRR